MPSATVRPPRVRFAAVALGVLVVLAWMVDALVDGPARRDASAPSDAAAWGPPYPGDADGGMALDAHRPAAQPVPLAVPDAGAAPLLMMARPAAEEPGRPLVISTLDEDGRPWPGVFVTVSDMDGNVVAHCETRLAADGLSATCTVERPPGAVHVDGRMAGALVFDRRPPGAFTPAPLVGFPYVPPEWDAVALSLQPALTVRIAVTDAADGAPVPHATVSVHDGRVVDSWYTCMVPLAAEYTADADGIVALELASRAGRILGVQARAEGFAEWPLQEWMVSPGQAEYHAVIALERASDALCVADVH